MRTIIIAAFVALVVFQPAPVSAQEAASENSSIQLSEVSRLYDSLISLDVDERKGSYAAFAPEMRAQLWIHHLEGFLTNHPELTIEQRSLVFEAIGLLHTRTLVLTPVNRKLDTPSNRAKFDFERRARLAFDKMMYREAFVTLGPEQIELPGRVRLAIRSDGIDCECNTLDDTCPWWSIGCNTWTACYWDWGCGTFQSSECDGLCW